MDKSRAAFDYEEIAPGFYKVMPTGTLAASEYGFVYAASGAGNMASAYGGGGSGVKIFDFGVELSFYWAGLRVRGQHLPALTLKQNRRQTSHNHNSKKEGSPCFIA